MELIITRFSSGFIVHKATKGPRCHTRHHQTNSGRHVCSSTEKPGPVTALNTNSTNQHSIRSCPLSLTKPWAHNQAGCCSLSARCCVVLLWRSTAAGDLRKDTPAASGWVSLYSMLRHGPRSSHTPLRLCISVGNCRACRSFVTHFSQLTGGAPGGAAPACA